jgi:hypothetical protein
MAIGIWELLALAVMALVAAGIVWFMVRGLGKSASGSAIRPAADCFQHLRVRRWL